VGHAAANTAGERASQEVIQTVLFLRVRGKGRQRVFEFRR